jgi:SAM-dependent methyltransferase
MKNLTDFLSIIDKSLKDNTFVKMTLAKPTANAADLKNIYIRLVEIKRQNKLSFTHRYATRDEVKNFDIETALKSLENRLTQDFLHADLFTTVEQITFLWNKKKEPSFISKKNQNPIEVVSAQHDRVKNRLLDSKKLYFKHLDITDFEGNITKNGQKKFKQVNRYIEIIDDLLRENPLPADAHIADMGCGKGLLTFALYDFLTEHKKMNPTVQGFELRDSLTQVSNDLSKKCEFKNLNFVAADILNFNSERLDMLIALHACDTATDIAIAKGIQSNAAMILVAPCCHKQIRKQMNAQNELRPVLKHGILEERQAELVTDGIRALLMEAHGYKTKVFEFIETEHTPKNIMIVGIRNRPNLEALKQVEALKIGFGIQKHFLETLLN